jgi:hypothetical protein
MTELSAFKQLYSEMFRSGGEGSIPKKTIKCYVKESFPHFLVTDGFFYVACYFTKKAIDEFHSKYSSLNITDLRSRVIIISDWTLEMNKVNSANVFTSYGGLECKLIVKSFKPVLQEKDQPTLTRHPVNLYRDDEMKTLIQNYTHQCVTKSVSGGVKESVPDPSKFSGKGNVSAGVVGFASGASFNGWSFKEGKTATVDITSIFKQEKGADALRRLQAGPSASGKARVVGGAKKGAKGKGKAGSGVGGIVEKITKFTPGDKRSAAAKKSTARILTKAPTLQSPGGEKHAGTTDHQSMKEFKKMISFLKNKKTALGKRGGKSSNARLPSGKKSQK